MRSAPGRFRALVEHRRRAPLRWQALRVAGGRRTNSAAGISSTQASTPMLNIAERQP